jgi:hypothetical protein
MQDYLEQLDIGELNPMFGQMNQKNSKPLPSKSKEKLLSVEFQL